MLVSLSVVFWLLMPTKYYSKPEPHTASIENPQMNPPTQDSAALFQQQAHSRSSFHDDEHASEVSTQRGPSDLEKAETIDDAPTGTSTGAYRANTSGRVSRIQSLQQKRTTFNHPLSHVKTSADVIVDFDGPDDPYRPINWPFRKKTVTTALYGLTTFGSTWASSVYVPTILLKRSIR